jgi:hypothetical protein
MTSSFYHHIACCSSDAHVVCAQVFALLMLDCLSNTCGNIVIHCLSNTCCNGADNTILLTQTMQYNTIQYNTADAERRGASHVNGLLAHVPRGRRYHARNQSVVTLFHHHSFPSGERYCLQSPGASSQKHCSSTACQRHTRPDSGSRKRCHLLSSATAALNTDSATVTGACGGSRMYTCKRPPCVLTPVVKKRLEASTYTLSS